MESAVNLIERMNTWIISISRNLAILQQLIFVLSHGQASRERGFSLNKGVLNDNMTELSIISRRVVKDHLRILKVGASEVTITPSLIKSVALSHSRYSTFLLKQKEQSLNETKQILDNEIRECERKRDGQKQLVDSLNKEFIENSLKVANESDANKMRELLVKERGMKQETEKDEKEVAELESAIVALKKRKSM